VFSKIKVADLQMTYSNNTDIGNVGLKLDRVDSLSFSGGMLCG
jgi:hypothetical protein